MIGVGVTTRDRPAVLADTLDRIKRHTPVDYRLVVVDDASDPPALDVTHRFGERVGIARAKNKCLDLLMADPDVEHVFLLDDDCAPATDDTWRFYIDAPEPYLCYTFTHFSDGKNAGGLPGEPCEVLYDDGVIRGLSWERGCATYVHRSVIDRVGGYWTGFGLGFWEHVDYSRRVHNAGLSTFTHQDVADSDKLWHSLDRSHSSPRSFSKAERDEWMARNTPLAQARKDSSEYVEYRTQHNIVLSCLFTGIPDTQRKGLMLPANAGLAKTMAESVTGADVVLLHNQLGTTALNVELVKVPPPKIPVYFQRWLSYAQYLRSHEDIRWVALLDATDTEMLHAPWDHLQPGILYIGHQPDTCQNPWLVRAHPHEKVQAWLADNPHKQLVNPGVILGDRDTVLQWCAGMVDMYFQLDRNPGAGDLAAANMLAYSPKWADRIEWGSHIVSVFRAEDREARAFIRHK